MKIAEFFIGGDSYIIKDEDEQFKTRGHHYYKHFIICKDDKFWSAVDIGIPDPVIEGWKQRNYQINIVKFLSEISLHIIKIRIYNNEINKINEGDDITSYLLCYEPNTKNQIKVFSTPTETIEYYRKQAEEIS